MFSLLCTQYIRFCDIRMKAMQEDRLTEVGMKYLISFEIRILGSIDQV